MLTIRRTTALLALSVILHSCGNAQTSDKAPTNVSEKSNSYDAWKKEAETEIRLNPRYGDAVKSEQQKAADEQLINSFDTQEGGRRKGAENMIKVGFDYLSKGDLRTAMYRFNQAWLLDSTNLNVYSGFAGIYHRFKDYKKSIKILDEGLSRDPKASGLMADQATSYIAMFASGHALNDREKALSLFKASYAIDPRNQLTVYKLSRFYFMLKNCEMAVKYYKECLNLGGQSITQDYKDALKSTCGL